MFDNLRADLARYPSAKLALAAPGFWGVASYRAWRSVTTKPLLKPLKLLVKPAAFAVQMITGIEIPPTAEIGPGLYIGHWGGIVISGRAKLGASCNLSQGVTIGVGEKGGVRGVPTLGDRVYVAPGAKVFGPIRVGSDSAIGANAVVNADVPDAVSVGGIPAKVISERGSKGMIDLRRAG